MNDMFARMAEFFLNPLVRERFKQAKQDPIIKGLLACESVDEMQSHLIGACSDRDGFIATITRYLKKVVVKPIKISTFTPSSRTIEREKIPEIVEEFRQFLEAQFDNGIRTMPCLSSSLSEVEIVAEVMDTGAPLNG